MQNFLSHGDWNADRSGSSILQRIIVIIAATVASIVWAGIGVVVFFSDPDSASSFFNTDLYFKIVAISVPIGLFWVVTVLHNSLATTRSELFAIQAEIAGLRGNVIAEPAPYLTDEFDDEPANEAEPLEEPFPELDDISPLPDIDSPITEVPEVQKPGARPPLPTLFEGLTKRTLIHALNFADDENDKERVEAIEAAMTNANVAELLKSSYSVLDYLAERGIDTDDLLPSFSQHDIWRVHAASGNIDRIGVLGQLGSDQDVESAATLAAKDMDFKKSVQSFLVNVHTFLKSFLPSVEDNEIAALGKTRTIRAYVLLGNATGGD